MMNHTGAGRDLKALRRFSRFTPGVDASQKAME
jgi:hypothetical protein